MPAKVFNLQSGMTVRIVKRRNAKYIRLRIDSSGTPTVTIPYWTPYAIGVQYANSKFQWIIANHRPSKLFYDSQIIGKSHSIRAVHNSKKQKCLIRENEIIIHIPESKTIKDSDIQGIIYKNAITALKIQAEYILKDRIIQLAKIHNFNIKSIRFKNLKGRWGSCDQHQNITLNIHLLHLPWELIDYVLLHELTHTKIMKHGSVFWSEMKKYMPDVDLHRNKIKNYQPNFNN